MYGAIIGDIAGSKYEFANIKTKDFPFISDDCMFTDDTVMTVAVAKALLRSLAEKKPFKSLLINEMQSLGKKYPYAGYGGMFAKWIYEENPIPYNSFGNGSAMRVSPCGLIAVELNEAIALAKASAEITHNHPEGIKGAEATAAAIFLARTGKTKEEIKKFICENYYDLTQTLDEIRPFYSFNETCQKTVPQAIIAFYESTDYEDAVRNAISIGGDSDTLAAITGSIAWSYYRLSCDNAIIKNRINDMLPSEFVETIDMLDTVRTERTETYNKTGFCLPITIE